MPKLPYSVIDPRVSRPDDGRQDAIIGGSGCDGCSSPSPAALLALELALELDLQLEGWSGRSPGLGAGLELEQHEGAMAQNLTGPATWLELG